MFGHTLRELNRPTRCSISRRQAHQSNSEPSKPDLMSARGDLSAALRASLELYKPLTTQWFPYGTAGFRAKANVMQHVFYRCSLVAVIRSFAAKGAAVGVCVTASHNPAPDNGVKLIDTDGGMLCAEFEGYATEFINSSQPLEAFTTLASRFNADFSKNPDVFRDCLVIIGRDTRASSPALAETVIAGVKLLGAQVYDLGVVTTPQVHFIVQQTNIRTGSATRIPLGDYYTHFSQRVEACMTACGYATGDEHHPRFLPERLVCDGANGVGAQRVGQFRSVLRRALNVELEVRNDGTWVGDALNDAAGAEFVQKKQRLPAHFGPTMYDPMFLRCCAFDGDADRLVYFSSDASGSLILLDGDKIAVLYSYTLARMLKAIHDESPPTPASSAFPLRLGVVQTAYANGASTRYLEHLSTKELSACSDDLSFDVACVKTGVKNLHRKAEEFDIAVYFESNGHGTITMKSNRLHQWAEAKRCLHTASYHRLISFLQLFNQATGDAMTDMLGVEVSLRYLQLSFLEWIRLYQDLPCIQQVVPMPRAKLDRLKPHPEHERILIEPQELQHKIDTAVAAVPMARAFVRPSGTEDVCRVYAEAPSHEACQQLVAEVRDAIEKFNNL